MRIEPEQYRTVGACLAAARGRANLTQTEAAERLGRKQTFLSEIERGLRRVDVLEIVLISRALDANPLQLFAEVTRSTEAELKVQKPQRPPKARRAVSGFPEAGRNRNASEVELRLQPVPPSGRDLTCP